MYTTCGCEGHGRRGGGIYTSGAFWIHACFETRRMAPDVLVVVVMRDVEVGHWVWGEGWVVEDGYGHGS
jgi:hypothetical protein